MLGMRVFPVVRNAILACALAAAPAALAGDHRHSKPDVDIDSLDAKIVADGDDWLITVKFKVEVDDAHPQERFTLGVQIKEDGYTLADADGNPFTTFIALDRPVKWDGDERVFEGQFDVRPPLGAIRKPGDLRVKSFVTREGDDCQLDEESTSVDYCRPRVVVVEAPPVVEVVRPAPVVEIVRPARVIVHHVARPTVVVSRPVYSRPVIVHGHRRGGAVGVRVQTDDVRVRVGARW